MSYICRRKTISTKKDAFFKEPKKAFALAGLDKCGLGLMFFMSLIIYTKKLLNSDDWLRKECSSSVTRVQITNGF